MSENVTLKAQLIAATNFFPSEDVDFGTDADGGETLIEFSGRACYKMWNKPSPRTATNRGYLRHMFEVGHTSLSEHANTSTYVRGLSRSCAHELTRHRHFSFPQLSQRFVPASSNDVVVSPAIGEGPDLLRVFESAVDQSHFAYGGLLDALEEKWADEPNAILRRKQVRQAARAVLPNTTETQIVVTGNSRSWHRFILVRATEHVDTEIRELAVACLRELQRCAPVAFRDFEINTLKDGSIVASNPYALEG